MKAKRRKRCRSNKDAGKNKKKLILKPNLLFDSVGFDVSRLVLTHRNTPACRSQKMHNFVKTLQADSTDIRFVKKQTSFQGARWFRIEKGVRSCGIVSSYRCKPSPQAITVGNTLKDSISLRVSPNLPRACLCVEDSSSAVVVDFELALALLATRCSPTRR